MPEWLGRCLPNVDIEGTSLERSLASAASNSQVLVSQ